MSCLIVLNGECSSYEHLKKMCSDAEFLICADGGLKHLEKLEIKPDIVAGDFDSAQKPENIETIVYPAEKDLTDFEIVLNIAEEKGFDEIKVTCALGGRYDHELANIMLLTKYKNAVIEDENNLIFAVEKNEKIENFIGATFSIIPTEKSVISLKGVKYPLDEREINVGDTLTVSNIVSSDCAEISVLSGKILVFINK